VLLPAAIAAYVAVLFIGKTWAWQSPGADFKPQIAYASVALTMAILVLTSVATAVSTRLGQVMTIVTCAGVFLFGLLSNYFVGRHVFQNTPMGIIEKAEPEPGADPGWIKPGAIYTITFKVPPSGEPKVGDSFYYSTSPTGFPMAVDTFPPFKGDVTRGPDLLGAPTPGLVITKISGETVDVRKSGQDALRTDRPPERGDYAFLQPTRVNVAAMALWGITTNLHHFWLLDAVSQNQRIPGSHIVMVVVYGTLQIAAFLCVGIVLFQKRDVG
jgi:hypothetical protein